MAAPQEEYFRHDCHFELPRDSPQKVHVIGTAVSGIEAADGFPDTAAIDTLDVDTVAPGEQIAGFGR